MADPNTIRVLEFDGGGQRGYFSMVWFDKFLQLWGIDPTTVWQYFDIICGSSIGGINALGLALGLTPAEILPLFETYGPSIFSLSSIFSSWRPNAPTKAGLIVANIPFYQSSGITASLYGSGLLTDTIQTIFGSNTLQDLKTNVVIPSYQQDTSTLTLFSNLNGNGLIGQNSLVSDVALATSAAPAYLPAWTFGGHTYIDAGVYQNNPASFAISLGKTLKLTAKRICVLSVGTGLGTIGFDNSGSPGIPLANNPLSTTASSATVVVTVPTTSIFTNGQNVTISGATATGGISAINLNITAAISIINSTSFSYTAAGIASSTTTGGGANVIIDYITDPPDTSIIETLFSLFEIASTGGQESIAKALSIESSNPLTRTYYYRFNPILDPLKNTELDNTDSSIMTYYHDTAVDLFDADEANISIFLGHLTA